MRGQNVSECEVVQRYPGNHCEEGREAPVSFLFFVYGCSCSFCMACVRAALLLLCRVLTSFLCLPSVALARPLVEGSPTARVSVVSSESSETTCDERPSNLGGPVLA